MRARIGRLLTSALTSSSLRDARRTVHAMKRRASGARPIVRYFHCVDDPYSHLAAQMLAPLAARYDVAIEPLLAPPPEDSAAPERQRLADFALRDAKRVARRHGLSWPEQAKAPTLAMREGALAGLVAALASEKFAKVAPRTGWALWSGAAVPTAPRASEEDVAQALLKGGEARKRFGHYLGGMFHFEGEWYWGIDRLHHLETRLAALGLDRTPGLPMLAPFQHENVATRVRAPGVRIEYFFSFRSPYSYIALPRVAALAQRAGADLRLRPILPMVMRGLPVPREKRLYIVTDCKREADRVGLPFGKIVDPVGKGVERAIAVLHRVVAKENGVAFAESALKGAFADGIDLASDEGLAAVARRAGVSDEDVRAALADESWRSVAEENRLALFEAGLWGAPTFRAEGGPAHWGQDRIWALEEDLAALAATDGKA